MDNNIENNNEYVNENYANYVSADDIFEDDEDELEAEIIDDDFSEVLVLTNSDEDEVMSTSFSGSKLMNTAEFEEINTVSITEKQTKLADKFVTEVSKFIKKIDDIELSVAHKKYIDTVAELKITNLAELLIMRDINKQFLMNIVNQINQSGGEDFVLINNYTTLVKTQSELIKTTNSLVNSIPNEIKALRNDILSNKELMNADKSDLDNTVIASKNTHNNGKSLLKQINEMKDLRANNNKKSV